MRQSIASIAQSVVRQSAFAAARTGSGRSYA
jgi:hypothetical protein